MQAKTLFLAAVLIASQALAEDNRIALLPITPQRGLIYDRNGTLLADNLAAYTLEITPNRVQNIDRTIEELSRIIEIPARDQRRFKRLLADARSYEPIPIKTRVSDEELARLRGGEGIAFNAWNLHQSRHGVTGQTQVVFQSHLGGVFDLARCAAQQLRR